MKHNLNYCPLSGGEVKALLIWRAAEQQMCLNLRLNFRMAYNGLRVGTVADL